MPNYFPFPNKSYFIIEKYFLCIITLNWSVVWIIQAHFYWCRIEY